MTILEKLKEKNIISEDQFQEFQNLDDKQALSTLYQKKLLKPEDVLKIRSEITGFPTIVIPQDFVLSFELLKIFPEQLILRYKAIPFLREGDEISIALVEPESVEIQRALEFMAISEKLIFKKFIISQEDFERILHHSTNLEYEMKEALERFDEKKAGSPLQKRESTDEEIALQRLVQQAPITQMVDVILRYGVEGGASDIHIEPLSHELRVRYRLDGELKSSLSLPRDIIPAMISRIKILAKLRVDQIRIPQGGRIHMIFGARPIDFRVSTFPTVEGEKVVLRILDPTKGIVSLESLGLQYKVLEDVKDFMKKPFGAMLISGPTGSGKSTTMYSILNALNREAVNIITLEDPVEYYLAGINQSQVQPEINYTFASGLREVLRQDPNIIMVGEVRDKETATLLTHAALTGHLVLSTVHTNDAIGIIPRLLDMGVEAFLIPAALRLAVAQRLIPKLCQECKVAYDMPAHIRSMIEHELGFITSKKTEAQEIMKNLSHTKLYKSPGCSNCGKLGVKGRLGVYETLVIEPELERAVISDPSESNFRKIAKEQGMITMRQDGIFKAIKGILSIEGVLATTSPSFPT